MKAYVYLAAQIENDTKWLDYTRFSAPAVKAAGGRYLIAGEPVETLEGKADDRRHVLVQFDSAQHARDFYRSAEYQTAKARRNGAADVNTIILEEFVPHPAPGWSIANWIGFWSNPKPELVRARVPRVVTPDVTGYWPFARRKAQGVKEYCEKILAILALVPDLKLELNEFAVDGNCVFIRWTGHGTGPDGSFTATGVDRVITKNGLVYENRIFSDCEIFKWLAERTNSL